VNLFKDYENLDADVTVVEESLPHIFQVLKSCLLEISSLAQTLGPWVGIQLKTWMLVCVHSVFV
jgi:hypothetical protein